MFISLSWERICSYDFILTHFILFMNPQKNNMKPKAYHAHIITIIIIWARGVLSTICLFSLVQERVENIKMFGKKKGGVEEQTNRVRPLL